MTSFFMTDALEQRVEPAQYRELTHLLRRLLKERLATDRVLPVTDRAYPHLRNPDNRRISYRGFQNHTFRPNVVVRWPVEFGNGRSFHVGSDELAVFLHMDMVNPSDYREGLVLSDKCWPFRPIYGEHIACPTYIPILVTRIGRNSKPWKEMLQSGDYVAFADSFLVAVNGSIDEYKKKHTNVGLEYG